MPQHHGPTLAHDDDVRGMPLWVHRIGAADVVDALEKGVEDFRAIPTHGVLVGLFYAIAGLFIVAIAFDYALLPLVVPLVGGFAMLGPFAAVGFYELSRRREAGLETRWWHMAAVFRVRSGGALLGLGFVLAVLFFVWMALAAVLTQLLLGDFANGPMALAAALFTTPAGWTLLVLANLTGLVFAVVAFSISVVAFPLLVDREVAMVDAALMSVRVVAASPGPMALWALIVAGLLALGALPALIGLAVVLPILGHATWHLYRKTLVD